MSLIGYPKPRTKDFLETKEGLIFAVVSEKQENNRVLSFLRYKRLNSNRYFKKFATGQANIFLQQHYPEYYYHSETFDADLHAVPFDKIVRHHQPINRLDELLSLDQPETEFQIKLVQLIKLLTEQGLSRESIGVTGSFLIGAENKNSDIDLVIYERNNFQLARRLIEKLIKSGQLDALDEHFWLNAYQRRSCSLSLEEYIQHEKTKYNKAVFQAIKFDLSLVTQSPEPDSSQVFVKKDKVLIQTTVTDDQFAYDTPCSYRLAHPELSQLFCFTPTYAGQATIGDEVEVSGYREVSVSGEEQRLIVGTSREAKGEYIKRINVAA